MQLKGIDVSHYQGNPDWGKVKADGVDFAFIKASQGTAYKYSSHFIYNAPLALKAGIPVGAYHYATFSSVPEAITEAQYMMNVIKGIHLTYPLVLDIEENKQKVSAKQLTDACIAFLEFFENKGYFVMWYSYDDFILHQLEAARLSCYAKWVANPTNKPAHPYDIWQYDFNGAVNGISGAVDLNYSYRDFAAEIAAKNYKPPATMKYVVAPNDTLSGIALRFKSDVPTLMKMNPSISNPNKIVIGQSLQVPKK